MARPPKEPPLPAIALRAILAGNVGELMNWRYGNEPNKTARIKALAKKSGIGKGTIERIVNCAESHFTALDKIAVLADHFGLPPHQLLVQSGARDWLSRDDLHGSSPARRRTVGSSGLKSA